MEQFTKNTWATVQFVTLKYYARATEKGKLNAAGVWKRSLASDNKFEQDEAQ